MTGLLNVVEFLAAFGGPVWFGIWASRRAELARRDMGRFR